MTAFVYILANRKRGALYVGVTTDLARRIHEHKTKSVKGFTARYSLDLLVYCESFDDVREAIAREKCIKRWNRAWKIARIEEANPYWRDLTVDMVC